MVFIDHFSELAEQYSQYRPGYPLELFDYLTGIALARELAWDCGTGSGQAAVALTRHFQSVIATDASREQIANAFPHPRVDYRVEPAEITSIENGSVDLITVGTAVHWFDFDLFYTEAQRVGKSGAVLAVWTYHLPVMAPDLDDILERYYRETLNGYWSDRLKYLDARYTTLPFPFDEIEPPVHQSQWLASPGSGYR
jgi:ubiquinone/menaquinone biosynthesis C-methylase UbiE